MMRLAGLAPCGVLCELTNPDGTMARLPEIVAFAKKHEMPVLTVDDLIAYRREIGDHAPMTQTPRPEPIAARAV
jgi:3,4-dihydroxy 2-butanone 4-phosphate synthase